MSVDYVLEELVGGHSGAENYKLSVDEQSYMLKIFPEGFKEIRIRSIPYVCELYQKLGIDSLKCLEIGKLSSTGQYFCIYNYIDGKNMEEIGEGKYTPAENYQLGRFTGKWAALLKAAEYPDSANMREYNIDELNQHVHGVYKKLKASSLCQEVLLGFRQLDLDEMFKMFQNQALAFDGLPKRLIHGDIKRSNLMMDNNGTIYLIDIESMKYGYDMFNFRYQLTWLFRHDNLKRRSFLKGFFDGLYNGGRPERFNNQFIFVYLLNFFEHMLSLCEKDDAAKAHEYCKLIGENWPFITSANGYVI